MGLMPILKSKKKCIDEIDRFVSLHTKGKQQTELDNNNR
jgi:hypothetical protein